jgi:outer membrane beta-barrel protein
MTRRHACVKACFIWLGCILASAPAFSQSLEDLESEVLGGKPSKSNSAQNSTDNLPAENTEAPAPVLEENVDASQLSAKKSASDDDDSGKFSKDAAPKEADEKVYKDIDELLNGPKSIPMKHIFVVKHQYIFTKRRHEIIPFSLGIQPADSFRKQISMGLSYIYHITESLSVEALHVNFLTNLSTGFSDDLSKNTDLEVERIEPVVSIGAALQWAPFRGKSATAENIYHFEGYFFLGGGYTQFEVGSSGMIMGGLGTRLFINRRSTLKFEVRDYYDMKADVGNRLNLVIGAGILLGEPTL